jgi:hypothetical protein
MWYIIYINKTILLIAKCSAVHPGSEAEVVIADGKEAWHAWHSGQNKEGL